MFKRFQFFKIQQVLSYQLTNNEICYAHYFFVKEIEIITNAQIYLNKLNTIIILIMIDVMLQLCNYVIITIPVLINL